jgi:hypothetical protein
MVCDSRDNKCCTLHAATCDMKTSCSASRFDDVPSKGPFWIIGYGTDMGEGA